MTHGPTTHGYGTALTLKTLTLRTLTLLLVASAAGAQERTLGPPTAVHPQTFSVVNTVRELSDGRVMVADPLAKVFVVLDADLQGADTLARLGEGPQEYRQPDAVWPLPGDSTLLVDLGNARLTVVPATGPFGRTRPIAQGSAAPGTPPVIAIPQGVDATGAIYYATMPAMSPDGPGDSASVLRLGAAGGAPSEVARIKTREFTSRTSGGANERNVSISPIPLSATDVWAVAPDGSLAIARAGERRVDWVAPDGTVQRGAPIELPPVRIGRAEKEEWAADQVSSGGGVTLRVEEVNGRRSMSMARGGGGDPDLDALTWPEAKAPWVGGSGQIDHEGRFWVRRSLPAGEPALYDVFDRAGAPVAQVRLGEGRQLVGFGAGTLYAVHLDAFDLKILERYDLPLG